MKKIIIWLLLVLPILVNAQLRKDQLGAINTRDIKCCGSVSSLKLGKLNDSTYLSLLGVKNNLSDLNSISAARTNLGLGTLATLNSINNSNWSGTALADGNIASASTWNAKQNAITFGTGVQTALGNNIGSAGALLLFNGAGGTPSSMTGTNITGIPESGVTGLTSDLSGKQSTLVSGTNIKTINSTSLLGSGDITTSLTPTAVKTSNYTASVGDLVKCDLTSGFTVTLPTAPTDKSEILVKIVAPSTVTNTLTIAAGGSDVFNVSGGSTSLSLTRKFQSVWLQYQSSGALWIVKTSDDALGTYIVPVANGGNGGDGGINTQTTNYTAVLADASRTVYFNASGNVNFTIPDNSSVAYPIGSKIYWENLTANTVTVVQGGSTVITASNGSLIDAGQGLMMQLTKTGTNTWDLQNGAPNPAPGAMKTLSGDVTTTSATLVDITGLSWTVTANTSYRISGALHIACNNTGGIKIGNSGPSGFTTYANTWGHTTGPTVGSFGAFTEGSVTTAYITVNNSGRMFIDGTVTIGSTGGTYKIQFESTTAGQTSTVFSLGTIIKLEKIQ